MIWLLVMSRPSLRRACGPWRRGTAAVAVASPRLAATIPAFFPRGPHKKKHSSGDAGAAPKGADAVLSAPRGRMSPPPRRRARPEHGHARPEAGAAVREVGA